MCVYARERETRERVCARVKEKELEGAREGDSKRESTREGARAWGSARERESKSEKEHTLKFKKFARLDFRKGEFLVGLLDNFENYTCGDAQCRRDYSNLCMCDMTCS